MPSEEEQRAFHEYRIEQKRQCTRRGWQQTTIDDQATVPKRKRDARQDPEYHEAGPQQDSVVTFPLHTPFEREFLANQFGAACAV